MLHNYMIVSFCDLQNSVIHSNEQHQMSLPVTTGVTGQIGVKSLTLPLKFIC